MVRCLSAKASSAAALIVIVATLAVAPNAGAAGNPAKAWCSLKPGSSHATVVKALGKPHGSKEKALASRFAKAGVQMAEWDVDGDILLVTFAGNGTASNLQAYGGFIPVPATNLHCKAFRNANGR